MASPKQPQTAKKVETPKESNLDITPEQRLTMIITRAIEDPDRGVPALIGPTQWGKTAYVFELLRALGIKSENIMTINPQNDLPEDIAGWPRRDGDYLSFTQPANIRPDLVDPKNYDAEGKPKVPWALFIDEMDKAQEVVLSCFLTLLNPDERRLRHTRISRYVPIIVAMNEPEGRSLPDPLLARMLFLEFPPKGMQIYKRPHLRPVEHIASDIFADNPVIKFPTRPKAPGSLHKLVRWMAISEFWRDEATRRDIVRGLFPEALAGAVLGKLHDRTPNPSREWAMSVRPTDMAEHLLSVLNAGQYEDCVEVIDALTERANTSDPTQELTRLLIMFFETPEVLHAVHRPDLAVRGQAAYKERLQVFLDEQKHKGASGGDTGKS